MIPDMDNEALVVKDSRVGISMLRGKMRQASEQSRYVLFASLSSTYFVSFFAWSDGPSLPEHEIYVHWCKIRQVEATKRKRHPRGKTSLEALCVKIAAEVESMIYERHAYAH
jgi:hypothetical protein